MHGAGHFFKRSRLIWSSPTCLFLRRCFWRCHGWLLIRDQGALSNCLAFMKSINRRYISTAWSEYLFVELNNTIEYSSNGSGWWQRSRRDVLEGSCGEGCRGCGNNKSAIAATAVGVAVAAGPGPPHRTELLAELAHQFWPYQGSKTRTVWWVEGCVCVWDRFSSVFSPVFCLLR
jgi:hypothetical protein